MSAEKLRRVRLNSIQGKAGVEDSPRMLISTLALFHQSHIPWEVDTGASYRDEVHKYFGTSEGSSGDQPTVVIFVLSLFYVINQTVVANSLSCRSAA